MTGNHCISSSSDGSVFQPKIVKVGIFSTRFTSQKQSFPSGKYYCDRGALDRVTIQDFLLILYKIHVTYTLGSEASTTRNRFYLFSGTTEHHKLNQPFRVPVKI